MAKKYIDADKLLAEIKFAKSVYSHPNRVVHGVADACRQDGRAAMCDDILKKIDSLQQEQPEESFGKTLDEAANKFAVFYDQGTCDGIAQDCFKAGAEWQKEQMMKDAVEYKIVNNLAAYPVIYYEVNHLGLKYGDKVRIIIVKEEESK